MIWLPSWNSREERDVHTTNMTFITQELLSVLWSFPYSTDRTDSLDNTCFRLFDLWNHFHFRPTKHCENLKTGMVVIEWPCTTNHSATSKGDPSPMADLLIPFQPGFTSGVMLSSSFWNSSLALTTSSWYWATILASDCAAWTWNKQGGDSFVFQGNNWNWRHKSFKAKSWDTGTYQLPAQTRQTHLGDHKNPPCDIKPLLHNNYLLEV